MNKPFNYKPTFGYLIWFAAFKVLSEKDPKHYPADYKYYSEKEFFVDVNLRFGQRFTLKLFKGLFRFLLRIGLV